MARIVNPACGTIPLVPLPPPTIESDLACIHCGYNLRTLRSGGNCPECGQPIWRSRLTPPDFRAVRRFEIARVIYSVAVLACLCASWYANSSFPHTTNSANPQALRMEHLLGQSAIACAMLFLLGLIWVAASRFPRRSRWVWGMLAASAAIGVFSMLGHPSAITTPIANPSYPLLPTV